MNRRDWLQKSLLASGASVLATPAMAQLSASLVKKPDPSLDLLQGQEAGGEDPIELQAYSVGLQAFEFGFPLVYFGNLMWQWMINPKSLVKPLNSWFTTKAFVATSNSRSGGSFNTDTVYAGSFIDMRKGPMVLSAQDPEGHYFSVQLSDLYTNNFAYISKRAGGPMFGNFLLVPPGWKGEIPEGKFDRVLHAPQKWLFGLVRLRIDQDSAEEVAWAKTKFAKTKMTPMDDFLAGREFVPHDHNVFDVTTLKDNPLKSFILLNHMLQDNPPPADEDALMVAFKKLNIGPGMDLSKNSPAVNRGLARAAKDGLRVVRAQVEKPWARTVNGWNYFPREIGQKYTNDYLLRASWQSLWGIVAHPPTECTYLYAATDQNGERLSSKGKYELLMTREQFPKVEAFWSFTMYQDFNLVENDINRWAIRENTKGLKFGADGSLRIYIQAERPSEDKVSNWLPSPKTGNFNLTMRNYMPSKEIVEQRYDPPVLKRVS